MDSRAVRANQVDHAVGANLIVQAAVLAVALAVTVSAPKSNRGIAWGPAHHVRTAFIATMIYAASY